MDKLPIRSIATPSKARPRVVVSPPASVRSVESVAGIEVTTVGVGEIPVIPVGVAEGVAVKAG